MNKKTVYLLSLTSLVLLGLVMLLTRPAVDNAWLLILFFVLYYSAAYFTAMAGGLFLGYKRSLAKRVALLTASVITTIQILITFNALRLVEFILITAVLVSAGWYISRAKT